MLKRPSVIGHPTTKHLETTLIAQAKYKTIEGINLGLEMFMSTIEGNNETISCEGQRN